MRQQLTSFDKLDPSYLLRKNLEREKDLKRLSPGDPEAGNIHAKLRRDYRTLITEHIQFVHKEKKDIHGLLWKTCFYKQIEEYRQSIRGHSNKLNSLFVEQSMGMLKAKEIEFEQTYLNKLSLSFVQYLNDSMTFYQRILNDLEERSQIPSSQSSANIIEMIVRSLHRCYLCLGDLARYKELYNEQREVRDFTDSLRFYERAALIMPASGNAHNQMAVLSAYSDDEFFGVFCYCRSIMVHEPFVPGLENLNSLFVKNAKAYDDSYVQGMSINSQQAKLNSSIMKLTNNSWKLNTFLFRFIFLHGLLFRWSCDMHRDYLMKIGKTYDQPSEQFDTLRKLLEPVTMKRMSESRDLTTQRPMDTAYFAEILRKTLDDFNDYLTSVSNSQFQQGQGCDLVFVRMVAISIFSIHFAVATEHNQLVSASPVAPPSPPDPIRIMRVSTLIDTSQPSDKLYHRHTIIESLALQTLYGLMNRTALHLTAINFKSQGKFYEVKPVYSHLIASLSVFTEWCSANTHYLMYQPPSEALTPKNYSLSSGGTVQSMIDTDLGYSSSEGQWGRARSSDNGFSPTLGRSRGADGGKGHGGGMGMVPVDWDVLYLADSDTLRNEVRAKSGMRAAVSDLRSTIVLDIDSNRHASDAKTNPTTLVRGYLPMSEDIMLRGFLPVADYIEQKCFADFNPIAKQFNSMKHYIALERFHRSRTVLAFIDTTLSFSKLKSPVTHSDDHSKAKPRTPTVEDDPLMRGARGGTSPSQVIARLLDSDEPYDTVVFKPAFTRGLDEQLIPSRSHLNGSGLMDSARGGSVSYDGDISSPFSNLNRTASIPAVGGSTGAGGIIHDNTHFNLKDDYWNLWSSSAPVVTALRGDLFQTHSQSGYDSMESASASSSRVIGNNKFSLRNNSNDSYDSGLSGLGIDAGDAAWNFTFEDDPIVSQQSISRSGSYSMDVFGNRGLGSLSSLDSIEKEPGGYASSRPRMGVLHTDSMIPRTMSSRDVDSYNLLTDTLDSDFSSLNLGIASMDKSWPFQQEGSTDSSTGYFADSSSASFNSTGNFIQSAAAIYAESRPSRLPAATSILPPPPGLDIRGPPIAQPPPGFNRSNNG